MRVEKVDSILSGGVSPVYRNHQQKRYIPQLIDEKKVHTSARFKALFERITGDLVKTMYDEGKVFYKDAGIKDFSEIAVGMNFDEKV